MQTQTRCLVLAVLLGLATGSGVSAEFWRGDPQPDAVKAPGQVTVVIKPDRPTWKYRETITGSLSITNTGDAAVELNAWWINSVNVTALDGKPAPYFSIQGSISFGPDAPTTKKISPGGIHAAKFSIYTDRMHSMKNGFYVEPGAWLLTYQTFDKPELRVHVEPIAIQVVVEPGEYAGPRIQSVLGVGGNLLVSREDGTVEIFDMDILTCIGTKRDDEFDRPWQGRHALKAISGDGRLIATHKFRESSISIHSLYGDQPVRANFPVPADVKLGHGGFFSLRFSADATQLICSANYLLVTLDVASGTAVHQIQMAEMWNGTSPDGNYAVHAVPPSSGSFVPGHVNCGSLLITDHRVSANSRAVTTDMSCDYLEFVTGVHGVYLTDPTARAIYVPYERGDTVAFDTDQAAVFVGETADGALAAFSWPRVRNGAVLTTTSAVSVHHVCNGAPACTVSLKKPAGFALLSGPPRLVVLPRQSVGGDWGGDAWLEERGSIYDALTGRLIREFDLTPRDVGLTAPK